jgi:predicted NUDIX family phosphoesterase
MKVTLSLVNNMTTALVFDKTSIIRDDVKDIDNSYIILDNPLDLLTSNKPKLLKRNVCETDEQYLQLIPYITLYDKSDGTIFVYKRGKKSSETRLTDRYSIGLGGHIELEPTEYRDIVKVISYEAARELNEEVGLQLNEDLIGHIETKIKSSNFGMIYYNGDSVGRVHLGISMFLGVDKKTVTESEADIVSKGEWLSFDDIENKVHNNEMVLENWSKIVVGAMTM